MKDRITDLKKFHGVFPAFFACYDDQGNISAERSKQLARYLVDKGANGLYLTGSSGESIYLHTDERKKVMQAVVEEVGDEVTIIAHVGAANTEDSVELATYASELNVDAISSIPPIYYPLSEEAIKAYWMAMIEAANLPFIIYNIPQNTGVNVSGELFQELLNDPRVIGIKNTSLPVMDILKYKTIGGDQCVVFNGPDEQFAAGRMMGADSGIGSTYSPMIELYLEMDKCIRANDAAKAFKIQAFVTNTIFDIVSCEGHLMASLKTLMSFRGLNLGNARLPLPPNTKQDREKLAKINERIESAIKTYC